MSGSSEFEEFINFWFAEYYSSGRDKQEIVNFLKSYPMAAGFLVDEIVEQLQAPGIVSGSSEFEEFMHAWFAEYYSSGRDKQEIVKFLKSHPSAAGFLVDEIVEQLQAPNVRYLGKKNDVKVEMRHQDIVDFFHNGPDWFHNNDYSAPKDATPSHDTTEWKKQSYDEKIFHLTVAYPEYSRQYLEKIISLRKKTYPD